ncbi:hypothetical protein J6590_075834 [Homalodisca vitripennis]|nr:hypothetical protein J6590_088195 [Homalodisca vitripennis]KAG8335148.1 hypothetical protein J6590_075834 [Homalodisca vitripennis]
MFPSSDVKPHSWLPHYTVAPPSPLFHPTIRRGTSKTTLNPVTFHKTMRSNSLIRRQRSIRNWQR